MNCCDYDCIRSPNCPAGSKDSMPYEFWPGSIVAQELVGTEPLPGLMTYDDAQKQWITRPLYNHLHTENSDGSDTDADEPWLTGQRVLIGAVIFLASVVGISMAVLHFFRG